MGDPLFAKYLFNSIFTSRGLPIKQSQNPHVILFHSKLKKHVNHSGRFQTIYRFIMTHVLVLLIIDFFRGRSIQWSFFFLVAKMIYYGTFILLTAKLYCLFTKIVFFLIIIYNFCLKCHFNKKKIYILCQMY